MDNANTSSNANANDNGNNDDNDDDNDARRWTLNDGSQQTVIEYYNIKTS